VRGKKKTPLTNSNNLLWIEHLVQTPNSEFKEYPNHNTVGQNLFLKTLRQGDSIVSVVTQFQPQEVLHIPNYYRMMQFKLISY
jgi:hypothetical protein